MIEAPKIKGTLEAKLKQGLTFDVDVFALGLHIVNIGVDLAGIEKMKLEGEVAYGTESLNSPWSWDGNVSLEGSIGAGFIGRCSVNAGFEFDGVDPSWTISSGYEYKKQIPTDDEMNTPGRHGLWYTRAGEKTCITKTVTSATGRVWMDRNLGASRVATSVTDAEAFGDLYQWGRLKDGHEKRNSSTTTTLSSTDNPRHNNFILASSGPDHWRSPFNNNLWQGENGINNPCPAGFRLPTVVEWREEVNSWSSKDANGYFSSPLKLTTIDYRSHEDGQLYDLGGYWSSTVYNSGAKGLLCENYDLNYIGSISRSEGLRVRCIKDIPSSPAEAPKHVTSKTGRIWLDRNLGATRAAVSIDDELAYGDLYQWGRFTDGHEKRNSGISETWSSFDIPCHNNHIVWADWRYSQNNNLWQGVNGINNPCPQGFRLPTVEEWQEEINSWSSPNPSGAFSSPLKLPHGGYRSFLDGLIRIDGPYYWSINIVTTTTLDWFQSANLSFSCGHGNAYIDNSNRGIGMSVRCIKD